ncbi:MAG: hypothetical protein SCARUB_03653 [Candidatus Scalindua rubra]|uniref:Uncharacterized protein n=1 Tax=Candidatus Scalindua rubra TaxID=1872076 RepID=A0A1E3X6L7_9BACT|nr:MAG: hypothetical protein SCARUB_03653 [Candidatus Scalindua rubra]
MGMMLKYLLRRVITRFVYIKYKRFDPFSIREMFGYIIKDNLNIRMHRDIKDLPDGLFGG